MDTDGTEYTTAHATVDEAKDALLEAFTDGMNREPTETITADLAGTTLTSGVYHSSSLNLDGDLTLDGEGNCDATFIFQTDSMLTTLPASTVNLIGDAQAAHVFWVVGTAATLGTDSEFVGTVMASDAITAAHGATVDGQLLAISAAVTLDSITLVNDLAVVAPSVPEEVPSEPSVEAPSGDVAEETPPEDSAATAPAPALGEGTVDGGVLPNTGGIEWLVVAVAGLTLAMAGTVAYLRLGRGRHGRP